MKKRTLLKILLPVLCALWLVFVFSRSLKDASQSSAESGSILLLLQAVFPALTMSVVRKLAHFTEFFILGALLSGTAASFGHRSALPTILPGLAAAVCDELLQLHSAGRSCQVKDMLLDFCGVATAPLLFFLVQWLLRRRRAKKKVQSS